MPLPASLLCRSPRLRQAAQNTVGGFRDWKARGGISVGAADLQSGSAQHRVLAVRRRSRPEADALNGLKTSTPLDAGNHAALACSCSSRRSMEMRSSADCVVRPCSKDGSSQSHILDCQMRPSRRRSRLSAQCVTEASV